MPPEDDDEAPMCRICRDTHGTMITPCRCRGSIAHVCAECARTVARSCRRCETCSTPYATSRGGTCTAFFLGAMRALGFYLMLFAAPSALLFSSLLESSGALACAEGLYATHTTSRCRFPSGVRRTAFITSTFFAFTCAAIALTGAALAYAAKSLYARENTLLPYAPSKRAESSK